MNKGILSFVLVASCLAACAAAYAANSTPAKIRPTPRRPTLRRPSAAAAAAPAPLVVYFDMGSSTIRSADNVVLDHASRAFNEGKPIVMILTGRGSHRRAAVNLDLSQRRAAAVLGLIARGIPATIPDPGEGRDGVACRHQFGSR